MRRVPETDIVDIYQRYRIVIGGLITTLDPTITILYIYFEKTIMQMNLICYFLSQISMEDNVTF